ncbi:hypothetical protein AR457_29875 [Streptomyces agglomeratus]|uniref:Uncharacterized protein n=1 Tax=Streptomyces agglomeratus TaxID=285458 RepID=A0A1E5PEV0_9ACTN|nr:hypothetical protein [Streptomyces agglomeratus]OEJ28053.1 hypothetical protein AS594_29765 [Streptomyces agglomeratus]OEJ37885.1 hypothetical protein BGK70_06775 [Streptomyces agglomeratus]OEJ47731.1 hypothetical protein AR457_29875 [Streptomyces agglomeratus]
MLKSLISRRTLTAVANAVRSVVAPVSLMLEAPVTTAPEPTGLYDADEMPAIEDIEAAAQRYAKAVDLARAGDRGKRGAKKVLDRLPAGRYGAWLVSRVASNRPRIELQPAAWSTLVDWARAHQV